MKRCRKCGETKALADFVKNKRSKDGRNARCTACFNADQRRRYAEKGYIASKRKYREANRERLRKGAKERSRRWRKRHPEKSREGARKYRETHPEYHREWYRRNIESERERSRRSMRESRRRNPEADRKRRQRYRAKHREKVRASEREKTYARRALQPCSPELAAFMAELVTQPCVYCGATENITVDHIVPLSRGGKHEAENLAPACYPCNSSKCNRLLSEWNGRVV